MFFSGVTTKFYFKTKFILFIMKYQHEITTCCFIKFKKMKIASCYENGILGRNAQ